VVKSRVSPIRAVLRFVAAVLMVSGTLLIADAVLTVTWQEPISAFTAEKQQAKLEKKIDDPPRRVIERKPLKGDAIARLRIPRLDKTYFVVEGTDQGTLRKGPGHYPDTPLPGDRGTTAIAGHRTTYGAPFRHVDKLKKGDPLIVEMPDGTFTYRVEKTTIVEADNLSVKDKVAYDRLILSACHPLHSAAQRIIVFAKFVRKSKPRVKKD